MMSIYTSTSAAETKAKIGSLYKSRCTLVLDDIVLDDVGIAFPISFG